MHRVRLVGTLEGGETEDLGTAPREDETGL